MTTHTWLEAATTTVTYHARHGDPATARALLEEYERGCCITAEEARQVEIAAGLVEMTLFDWIEVNNAANTKAERQP